MVVMCCAAAGLLLLLCVCCGCPREAKRLIAGIWWGLLLISIRVQLVKILGRAGW